MLDVGAGGLRDPQPVQREQGDQCMLGRWAEPGGYPERAELVAVQGDGIGFLVHPRTADVTGGGRPLQPFLPTPTLATPPAPSAPPTPRPPPHPRFPPPSPP